MNIGYNYFAIGNFKWIAMRQEMGGHEAGNG